jgi:hypothetical protein
MAVNIYKCKLMIFFSETDPNEEWGWYMSTSSDGAEYTALDSESRLEQLVKIVNQKMNKKKIARPPLSGRQGDWEAFYLTVSELGGLDISNEWISDELATAMPEKYRSAVDKIGESKEVMDLFKGMN